MTTTTARRIAIALAAGAVTLAGLSACAPLVVGGAAVAGAGMVATDRRSSSAQVDDQAIELRGAARIRDIANDDMNVTVTSFNRQVLLTGTVGSDADRRKVEDAIRRVDNVRSVVNEVVVGPGSSFPDRSNDTFITGKVKAALLDQNDIFANSFKVVTERGVVYLMGIATRTETDRATDVARGTSGVKKVVRMVEVISDQELANLKAQQPLSQVSGSGSSSSSGTSAAPASSSSTSTSRVPLPPMEPLPGSSSAAPPATTPASSGVVTTPVR
ncbi:BON domain-containing protein [Variovorax sp. YR216]|uniref:BON domain-containing protein n=1 Tax=Variovorax sp. YR216 TaxID=1882828 RepID=UPI00089A2106|nr:BON domain-containing protein [Variovorax sp. YR216]SEA68093.1 Osmotically-inducible protein OsmY, contains BON domain [Variovorax sp. YR216]